MARIVREAKANPELREYTIKIVATVPEKDFGGEVEAIFAFVRDRIRYLRDINGIETVQVPEKTLEYGQGDCDDQSVLLATMLEIVGNECRFVAVGPAPGLYSHVFVQVRDPAGAWISLDPIMRVPVGWQAPGMPAVMTEGI